MNKKNKYRIGYTCGVFDLFHIGHLNLLERCKSMCNYLIVGICDDDYVRNVKGKIPVIPLEERCRIVGALDCVDEVVVVNSEEVEDKITVLKKYKFDVLFSGDDWKGSERYNKTEKQFAKFGASIEYFPYTKGISSSDLKIKINNTDMYVVVGGVKVSKDYHSKNFFPQKNFLKKCPPRAKSRGGFCFFNQIGKSGRKWNEN